MLIDVSISGDRNVIKKEAEKFLKYKDLTMSRSRSPSAQRLVQIAVRGMLSRANPCFMELCFDGLSV